MLRVALYARVSTEEQATEGASIAAQRKLLREYAGRGGMAVVAEFVDEGASARSADRPAFQQMVAAARRRPRPCGAGRGGGRAAPGGGAPGPPRGAGGPPPPTARPFSRWSPPPAGARAPST